jgi:hypothetical protein
MSGARCKVLKLFGAGFSEKRATSEAIATPHKAVRFLPYNLLSKIIYEAMREALECFLKKAFNKLPIAMYQSCQGTASAVFVRFFSKIKTWSISCRALIYFLRE